MLELQDVRKNFESLCAVDGVTLSVPAGKIIGLIGPNGSGKSTLMNVIAGSLPPTSGQIFFDGHDISHLSSDQIFRLGLARSFQNPSLFFRMTTLDNALLPIVDQIGERAGRAPWHRLWRRQEQTNARRTATLLEEVQLGNQTDTLASDLSGGQMKLLEMGRSLMGDPKLLLLDEPTAGVAPKLAYTIFEQIEQLRQTLGLTFLIVEHRLEILFDFVDSVYVMHMGRVIAQGTPAEIESNRQVREIYFGE